jgi:hypothetical protein
MGTWGPGVFDSDNASEFLDMLVDKLVKTIVFHLTDESLTGCPPIAYGAVVAAADILVLYGEQYDFLPGVSTKMVRRWRELYLQQFEADSVWDNALTPDDLDARTERRKVIEATFDRLEAVALDDDD